MQAPYMSLQMLASNEAFPTSISSTDVSPLPRQFLDPTTDNLVGLIDLNASDVRDLRNDGGFLMHPRGSTSRSSEIERKSDRITCKTKVIVPLVIESCIDVVVSGDRNLPSTTFFG